MVVVTLGSCEVRPLQNNLELHPRCLPLAHLASSAKQSGAGATLIFGGGVIYIWHVLVEDIMLTSTLDSTLKLT